MVIEFKNPKEGDISIETKFLLFPKIIRYYNGNRRIVWLERVECKYKYVRYIGYYSEYYWKLISMKNIKTGREYL